MMRRSCHGPCQQGREECPTPWACEIEDTGSGFTAWDEIRGDFFLAVVLTAAVAAIAALVAALI